MSQGPSWPPQGPPPPRPTWGRPASARRQPAQPTQPQPPWVRQVPEPPRAPDVRPLLHRKRVWLGGIGLFALGATTVGIGDQSQVTQAEALVMARPTVTATATATATVRVTVTAEPKAVPTVTKTVKVTVTVTATAAAADGSTTGSGSSGGSGGSTSGGSSGGGSGSASGSDGTCSLTSSAGNCYRAGEFCPDRDLGLSTTDANGNAITCEDDNGYHRWMDA